MIEKKVLHGIVEKAIAGDEESFETLYHMFAKIILFHTRNLIRVEEDAEDVAQEVTMQMYTNIGSLKTPYAFSSWLHRIIFNTCNNYNTRQFPRRKLDDGLETASELCEQKETYLPEANAEQEDLKDRFFRNILALPKMQQTALIMYYYEEMSYREIAKALDVKTGTIATNIKRAKENLKAILDGEVMKQGRHTEWNRGVAVGPFIAETLRYGVDKTVPAIDIERFCSVCDSKINAFSGVRNVAAHPQASSLLKVFTGLASAAVVVSVVVLLNTSTPAELPAETEIPAPVQQEAEPEAETERPVYSPGASVDFVLAGGGVGSVNPIEASIVVHDEAGQAIDWDITNARGEIVAIGDGRRVSEPFGSLGPGEYYIHWTIQDDEGAVATHSARFTIE